LCHVGDVGWGTANKTLRSRTLPALLADGRKEGMRGLKETGKGSALVQREEDKQAAEQTERERGKKES